MVHERRKRILIIYDHRAQGMVLTDQQHLKAIEKNAETSHDIVYLNFASLAPDSGMGDPVTLPSAEIFETRFDAVILHYAFLSLRTTGQIFYKWRQATNWIKKIHCPKIAIPMDEMDHAGLLDDWLFELETDAVFSIHYKPGGPLYPRTRTRAVMLNCLPGYIDESTALEIAPTLKPHNQRSLDIVYRANHLPYWYGSHCQLKHLIGEEVLKRAPARGFITDISTNQHDVIYGKDWVDFLASSRFTIGGEGGRTVLDYCGEKKLQVDYLLRENPSATFDQIASLMTAGWESERMLTITPRHFEAIITKTAQLLVKGEYKGILEADKHYIPFQPDFSDLDTALEKLKDIRYCENLAECAYEEVYRNGKYSYKLFVKRILEQIDQLQILYRRRNTMRNHDDLEKNTAIDSLERELNASRYQNILLQIQHRHVQANIQDLKSELQSTQAELQSTQAELQSTQSELQSVKYEFQLLVETEQAMREYIPVSKTGVKIGRLVRQGEMRPYLFLFLFLSGILTSVIFAAVIVFVFRIL